MFNPEAQEVEAGTNSNTASDASEALSLSVLDEVKKSDSVVQSPDSHSDESIQEAVGTSGLAEAMKEALDSNKHTPDSAMQSIKEGILQGSIGSSDAQNQLEKHSEGGLQSGAGRAIEAIKNGAFNNHFEQKRYEVTDKDRERAKESLADNELMGLLDKGDQELLKSMHSALIDGDLDGLKKSLSKLADNPEKLQKFVDIVNKTFDKNETFGGIEMTRDSKGNVLLYEEGANTAVSIDPKSGETNLRAIETQKDGSVVLKPGEIINRKPEDVMKSIGNEATESIVGPWHKIRPLYEKGEGLDGIGGGGGGGGGGNRFQEAKPNFKPHLKESLDNGGIADTIRRKIEASKSEKDVENK